VNVERLYRRLPVRLQHAMVSFEGWRLMRRRYGRSFRRMLDEIAGREYLHGPDMLAYQRDRLRRLLVAASLSPFWRTRFARYGVDVASADPFAEVQKLPVLTKEEVRDNAEAIRSPGFPRRALLPAHTSGTTGSGLVFWQTREAELEQWAVWWRYRGWHGITPGTWCGYFGGRSVVPLEQVSPPFWRINRSGRQLMLSIAHLRPETAEHYVEALSSRPIVWLHGYPSFLALLASFVIDQRLEPPALRLVTTGAESLLPNQRELISAAFAAPVREHYGQAEAVANISECELGRLHVDEDFSLVELLPDTERSAFRIVGTNWSNPGFPLLRYDTGDLATSEEKGCECGRGGRVVRDIDGRREDYVHLPNGARVGRLDHIFKDLTFIREAQIHQSAHGSITIRVVKGDEYDSNRGEEKLLAQARQRLGSQIPVVIEYIHQVPRSPGGKLRLVVSEVRPAEQSRTGQASF
jgi:phenylacetate-CoA ligase